MCPQGPVMPERRGNRVRGEEKQKIEEETVNVYSAGGEVQPN
jgi:hypothetical protein